MYKYIYIYILYIYIYIYLYIYYIYIYIYIYISINNMYYVNKYIFVPTLYNGGNIYEFVIGIIL